MPNWKIEQKISLENDSKDIANAVKFKRPILITKIKSAIYQQPRRTQQLTQVAVDKTVKREIRGIEQYIGN